MTSLVALPLPSATYISKVPKQHNTAASDEVAEADQRPADELPTYFIDLLDTTNLLGLGYPSLTW